MRKPKAIPREILFGNPEKAAPKISPDGKHLSTLAPDEGVLNIWLGGIHEKNARPITKDLIPHTGHGGASGDIIDALCLLYIAGTAALTRLLPIAAFFFCLAAVRTRLTSGKRLLFIGGVAGLAALEGIKSFAPYSIHNPFMKISAQFANSGPEPTVMFRNERAALSWLKEHAGPDSPVLAHYGISGPISAYTQSPVLLNPKSESLAGRVKSMDYLKALYSNEEDFHLFCRKYGARFFVYTTGNILDESRQGTRYDAGRTGLNLKDAAVRFHFFPGGLTSFRLVYQNPDFRIYSVGTDHAPMRPAPDPIYDIGQYKAQTQQDGTLKLDIAGVLGRIAAGRRELFLARILSRLGRREEALSAYEKAFSLWPPDEETKQEAQRQRF